MMYALTWRCDGSEGIKWHLRGIRDDGSFYGEVRFVSAEPTRRMATLVSGQLSPAECTRLDELATLVRQQPPPVAPGPHFAALFERLSPTNAGDVKRLFEYKRGDEADSGPARAFIELASLLEKHLIPFYARLAEQRVPPEPAGS
jgi:hypothetical protein